MVLGIVALVVGLSVVLTTLDTPFLAVNDEDVRLLRIVHLNTFGGILLTIVGVLALAGGRRRQEGSAVVAGGMASLMALWALVGLNTPINYMSARADTFTLFLMLSVGLLLFTLTPDPDN